MDAIVSDLLEELKKLKEENQRLKLERIDVESDNLLRPPHSCKPIARAVMSEGRDWWVGELIEPVKDYPQETHCLHMKTPLKDVIFLCNEADFEQLIVLASAVIGKSYEPWVESMVEITKMRAKDYLQKLMIKDDREED